MEIKVAQEKISKALNSVSRVAAGARATLPILNNVLIRVDDNKVSLTTTNLDMAVVSFLPATSSKNGVVTVPARLIAEFVSNLPRGELVEIKAENTKVDVTAGSCHSMINGALADDFPELPELEQDQVVSFNIKTEDFKIGLSQVMMAASNDTTRPALTGVYFNTFEGNLYVAATDGYRLAERCLVKKTDAEVSAIIPTSSLQEVLRSLSEEVEQIEVLFDNTQVRFRLGDVEITSKLIDGSFPDYRQLIPKATEISLELGRSELIRVTKLAALFAKEVGGSVVCGTSVEKGTFSVGSVANELGENSSEIKTTIEVDGKVTLNSRFLLDALNAINEEKISFGFSNKLDPVVMRGENNQDYIHIVMPLKS